MRLSQERARKGEGGLRGLNHSGPSNWPSDGFRGAEGYSSQEMVVEPLPGPLRNSTLEPSKPITSKTV